MGPSFRDAGLGAACAVPAVTANAAPARTTPAATRRVQVAVVFISILLSALIFVLSPACSGDALTVQQRIGKVVRRSDAEQDETRVPRSGERAHAGGRGEHYAAGSF